jgi:hypothetical protein
VPQFVANCVDAAGQARTNCFAPDTLLPFFFYGIQNPNDLIWVGDYDGDGNLLPATSNPRYQAPREAFLEDGTLGTYDNPRNGANVKAAYIDAPRVIGGSSFLSALADLVKPILAIAVVGLPALEVSGASGANVATNLVSGQPLTQNAGLAAGLDVAGLAAGSVIAASGIVDAAATTGAAPEISTSTDLATVDLSASSAPSIGGVDLTAGGSSVISAAPSAGTSLSSLLAGGKAAIGAVGTVEGLVRTLSPTPPKRTALPVPLPPVVAQAPACNTCQKARPAVGALAALLPLLWFAFS